jgi:hypothetical protein
MNSVPKISSGAVAFLVCRDIGRGNWGELVRGAQPRQLGGQIFCQAIDEIVLIGTPSEIGERQDYERQFRYVGCADRHIRARPRLGIPYRVGPHRPRNVL